MTNRNRPLEHWETTPEERRKRLLQDLIDRREYVIRLRDDSFNKPEYQDVFVELNGAIDSLTEAIRLMKVIHDENA